MQQPVRETPVYVDIINTIRKVKNDSASEASVFLIAGDYNAKIGKTNGESCLASYSRGIRNTSGLL